MFHGTARKEMTGKLPNIENTAFKLGFTTNGAADSHFQPGKGATIFFYPKECREPTKRLKTLTKAKIVN